MRASQIIHELLLQEKVDIDRGLVGLELELLIRNDVTKKDPLNHTFLQLLYTLEFSDSSDGSIERTPWSNDAYYSKFETNNNFPTRWSKLKPNLLRLLSWLKRTDPVKIRDTQRVSVHPASSKTVVLPRGKMPTNGSVGLHIHFDVATWFDSVEHAATFVKMFNRHGEELFKPSVLKSRYHDPYSRGQTYAPFSLMKELSPKGQFQDNPAHYLHYAKVMDKFSAVNCKSTLNRGDVEFRFMHGTLNINTIEGWLYALAELIEFSRTYKVPQDPSLGWMGTANKSRQDFKNYLSRENPEADEFLKRSAEKMAKAKIEPDPSVSKRFPPKRSRSLARRLKSFGAIKNADELNYDYRPPRSLDNYLSRFSGG